MKKYSIIILIFAMLLVGCGKTKTAIETPSTQEPATNSGQVAAPKDNVTPSTPPSKSNEPQPNVKDLEKLTKKLDDTKDEEQRKKVLADIQKILEQAEKNAPKQN